MTIAAGSRLGPYEILSPLGAGGMGEVYRARDMRLDRTVAIKVLSSHLSASPESRQRFEREAKTISQLSHPHICALHDVGREGDTEYLVMEYLEGETLADRLLKGPLPLEQTLRFGIQIADALDKAHRQGIVHRDLKPGNVMLTKSGVKLLDFGLAKAIEPELPGPVANLTSAPTTAKDVTREGTILGTLSYMAPEQLEGGKADPRTDIFAFGAVLYEMATGRKAFSGASQMSLISSILREDPAPISQVQPMSPSALDRLTKTCLAKDPDDRWQSAHDVELQLRSIADSLSSTPPAAAAVSRRRPVSWLAWAVAAVFAAVAAVTLLRPGAPKTLPVVTRFSIPPPANGVFVSGGVEGTALAVSPDGSQIAYCAWDRDGGRRIWARPLSTLEARPIAGTNNARSLFWSPESRSIGFFVHDKLKRIDLSGDAPVTICDVPAGTGFSGTWGTGGDILFAAVQGEAIYRVSAAGGAPTRILQLDRAHGEARCNWPWFLPDGRRFLYLSRMTTGTSSVMLFTPGSPPTAVLPVASKAQYAEPGFLVFVKDGVLLAQRFDSARGRVVGEPFSVAPTVRYFLSSGYAAFGLSQSGPLIYQSQSDVMRLVWFDRAGRQLGTLGPPGDYQVVAFSRDGRRVVFDRRREGIGTFGIWSADLERGTETPVTAGPDTEAQPILLPGEKSIAYSRVRGGPPQLVRHDLATGKVEELVPPGAFQLATDVSPDGKTLLYAERGPGGVFDLWTLPLAGDGKPVPFLVSPSSKGEARFSPDGRFVGLVSTESGRPEVYVTAYPGPGERIRISTEGANLLRWSRAGDLVYMSLSGSLVSVAVRTSPSLEIGKPKVLFKVEQNASWYAFSVSPDGNRFLAVVPELIADQLPLTVVANWTSGEHK